MIHTREPCWLQGYCATTEVGEGSDCRPTDKQGSWQLASVDQCLERCVACAHCRFISWSPHDGDCSWFSRCDRLHTEPPTGHRTRRIRSLNGTVLGECEALQWPVLARGGLQSPSSPSFHRLPVQTDCCRYNQLWGALAYDRYGEVNPSRERDVTRPEVCAAACLLSAHCVAFAHSQAARSCALCSSCVAAKAAGFTGWTILRNDTVQGHGGAYGFASRAAMVSLADELAPALASASTSWREVAAGDDRVPAVHAELQGEYSLRLYGARGRVPPPDSLRLLWAALMPRRAAQALRDVGVCGGSRPVPPHQRFFSSIGGGDHATFPAGAVWVSQLDPLPVPSGGWAEIYHCPEGDEPWAQGPMWLHVAPGSGVSVNVGRTLITTYQTAVDWLLELEEGRAKRQVDRTRCDVVDGSIAAELARHPRLARLDSLQIVRHLEYFSPEPRNELLLLRRRECERITASTPGVRCGREPELRKCTGNETALLSMARCAAADEQAHNERVGVAACAPHPLSASACFWPNRTQATTQVCPAAPAHKPQRSTVLTTQQQHAGALQGPRRHIAPPSRRAANVIPFDDLDATPPSRLHADRRPGKQLPINPYDGSIHLDSDNDYR